MKFLRITAVAALAISLVGCGSKKVYQPQIIDGTQTVLHYNKDTAAVLAPIRSLIEKSFSEMSDAVDFARFWKDSGLEESEIQWGLLTVSEYTDNVLEEKTPPECAVAVSVKHSRLRVLSALKDALPENQRTEIAETRIGGEWACKIVSDDMPDGVTPCATSLNGSLMIFALSPKHLERQIKLYRDGVGASKTLTADTKSAIRCVVGKMGTFVKAASKDDDRLLSMADLMIPNGKDMLLNLGDFNLTVTTAGDQATLAASLAMRSADEAKSVETVVTAFLLPVKAKATKAVDPSEKLLSELLSKLKIEAKNELLTVSLPLLADQIKLWVDDVVAD